MLTNNADNPPAIGVSVVANDFMDSRCKGKTAIL